MTAIKKRGVLFLVVAVTVFTVWIPAFASDGNYGYEFSLKTGYVNSYSDGRYRQTSNTENPWKVNMKYHSRGEKEKATYWLARIGDKGQASATHDIVAESGAHYYTAWAGASMVTVCLAAENFKDQTATVSGVWDEETL